MKEKTKVYIYTRVSTAVQVDGYSLDAQKSRMKAYAEFNDFEIVGEYEDLSLIHISEPTRRTPISYAVFCLKKKKKTKS